jgi:hypothetical protein
VNAKNVVTAQLNELDQIHPMRLGTKYYDVLQHSECTWYFWCHAEAIVPFVHPTLETGSLPAGSLDALSKGREMALAPTTPKPPAPATLPSWVHPHEPVTGTEETRANSDLLNSVVSDKTGGQTESAADRERAAQIAQIQENLKAETPLRIPDGSGSTDNKTGAQPIAPQTLPAIPPGQSDAGDLGKNIQKAEDPTQGSDSNGKLFMGPGFFPISTWRAIRGTPYAVIKTAGAIRDSGWWAIWMFSSCSLIWLVMLVGTARGDTPLLAYFMALMAPLGISVMVTCLQWLCKGALHLGLIGCLVTSGIMALAPSTALALAVGLRHMWKVPSEVAEGIEKIKSIV